MSSVFRLWEKVSSVQLAERITQSWKQRQLTRWDKYGKWGKAWHKWFPIQEKTPQCISSRHLTQSSPSLPPPPQCFISDHMIFVPSPVCVRGRGWGWRQKEKEGNLHLCFFLPKHTLTHTYTNHLKCWCHGFDPTTTLHIVEIYLEFVVFCFVFFLRDILSSITHVNRVPTMCLPLCQAHSISISVCFLIRLPHSR